MPDHGDENHPLTSSKKFSSVRFRRLSISSKRKSELKATISGPHAFDGGGVSTIALDDVPLLALNSTQLLHPSSALTAKNGPSPLQPTFATRFGRNSDIFLGQHHSSLAWPTNHPEIVPVSGSPHHSHHTIHKKPRKADISRPLVSDSHRFSAPGISGKTSRRSTQINRRPRFSGSVASGVLNGNPDEITLQKLSLPDRQLRVSKLLDLPSEEFDPRSLMESCPALDLDLNSSTASFGSVKQRTRKIDKSLRASRTMAFPVPQGNTKPDLVFTDDSDAFSSPPSTPSTPVWDTMAASSIPRANPKLPLDLADVHAQIQAMIDSTNRPPSVGPGDFLAQGQDPLNTYRTDIPQSLQPSNPMYRSSFPRLTTAHRRSASSPPLGSGTHHADLPDFIDRLLYRPAIPIARDIPPSTISPLSEMISTNPTSTTTADLVTPETPTKKSPSERSDSPSVYSQQSPTSQSDRVTSTSSSASSPEHPYQKNKHERLLAAISEGIPSFSKPGPVAPSILGSGRRKDNKSDSASPLPIYIPAVPVIVVTDPNDDNLVYSESDFSIVDMYAGSLESAEAGHRKRTRTTNSVGHISLHALAAHS